MKSDGTAYCKSNGSYGGGGGGLVVVLLGLLVIQVRLLVKLLLLIHVKLEIKDAVVVLLFKNAKQLILARLIG
jgi:hypothetical protein